MNKKEIRTFLEGKCGTIDCSRDKELGLLDSLVRGEWDRVPTVGIGGDLSVRDQINSLVDAIHWCRIRYPGEPVLRFVIGKGDPKDPENDHTEKVKEAFATLMAARHADSKPSLKFMLDEEDWSPRVGPTFETDSGNEEDSPKRWMGFLTDRSKKKPELVTMLSNEVKGLPFSWHLGVSAKYWSGRVEGVEVCRVSSSSRSSGLGKIRFHDDGKRRLSKAGREIARLFKDVPPKFSTAHVEMVAKAIRGVVDSRQKRQLKALVVYQPEHRFEARILRGGIHIPAGNRPGAERLKLTFEDRPFQFPAQWFTGDKARYVDILMKEGNVPWVVELKYRTKWDGGYFRHAISQAVLYREFIRKCRAVHGFLQNEKLDPGACKALVAFPKPEDYEPEKMESLRKLAEEFDVEVVLRGDVANL
jgi:hypothetical protein